MANVLSDEKKQQVLALGRLGWSLRKIEEATGVRRETAGTYLRAAGVAVRGPRQVVLPAKAATAGGVSTDLGFAAKYASVRRFVARLRGQQMPEARVVILTEPGQEGQVDYGEGPMVRHPETSKYRRTRLFVFTLGYSRKSVRLITFRSSSRIWAELHERAFRRLGGAPRVVVLDNLREGVLKADI